MKTAKIMKVLDETAMFSLGAGAALFGSAFAYIGASGARKNFVVAGLMMGAGAYLAYVGSQVAIGAAQRTVATR